ncbi:MAG: mobile mystery protein A [Alphaproteobacteria bacterium]
MAYRQFKTARRELSKKIIAFRKIDPATTPRSGWLRAIREALGMTSVQMAKRLGISQPSMHALEKREQTHSITLRTLEQAARALNCRVVYALVPNESLEDMVKKRALQLARKKILQAAHTMELEDQAVSKEEIQHQIEDLADELMRTPNRLWDDSK